MPTDADAAPNGPTTPDSGQLSHRARGSGIKYAVRGGTPHFDFALTRLLRKAGIEVRGLLAIAMTFLLFRAFPHCFFLGRVHGFWFNFSIYFILMKHY